MQIIEPNLIIKLENKYKKATLKSNKYSNQSRKR